MAAPAPCRRCGPRPGRAWRRARRRAGTSSGSTRCSIGSSPGREQRERLLEAVVVVGVGAGDDELVEQDPVRVEPGPLDAGADQHERAGLHELRQPRLHRLGLAGALEHHVDGVVDHAHRLGHVRHLELVGVEHPRGADGGGQLLAAGRRLGAADVVDAHRPQRGDARARRSARRRARAPRSPGWVPPWWMPWSATDSGSASAAARGSSPSGIGSTWAAGASL